MNFRIGGRRLTGFDLLALTVIAMALHPLNAAPCPAGLVIRQAAPGDLVCVTPESKRRVAAENARAALLWVPGTLGLKTCATGYVWRQGFTSDLTCVTPDVRAATLTENHNPQGEAPR